MSGAPQNPQPGPPQPQYADAQEPARPQIAAPTQAQLTLLSHVIEFADADQLDAGGDRAQIEPFLAIAREPGAETRDAAAVRQRLVEVALTLALGRAGDSGAREIRAPAAPVVAALTEDDAARTRLARFWERLCAAVRGERGTGT